MKNNNFINNRNRDLDKKKFKDFSKILAILIIFIVSISFIFAGLFGFLNYRKIYTVKADVIDYNATFTGSSLVYSGFLTDLSWIEGTINDDTFQYSSFGYRENEYWYEGIYRCMVDLAFNIAYFDNQLGFSCNAYFCRENTGDSISLDLYDDGDITGYKEYYPLSAYTGSTFSANTFNPLEYVFASVYHLCDYRFGLGTSYDDGVGQVAGFVIGDFNISDISGFNLWAYRDFEMEDFYNIVYCIQYFDSSNNSVVLCYYTAFFDGFDIAGSVSVLPNLPYRTYYFESALDDSSIAYQNGYEHGWIDKGDEDYLLGYDHGYSVGVNYGYNEGVLDANDYSFLGLIGAVVDAPVKAFTGLLNFDILGFNMLSFFTGLLTLCLILWIIAKALGNK